MLCSVLRVAAHSSQVAGGPSAAPKSVPRVIAVSTNAPLKLGGTVLVTVTNLSTLLDEARVKAKKVVLFVDGNEMADLEPTGIFLETNKIGRAHV